MKFYRYKTFGNWYCFDFITFSPKYRELFKFCEGYRELVFISTPNYHAKATFFNGRVKRICDFHKAVSLFKVSK